MPHIQYTESLSGTVKTIKQLRKQSYNTNLVPLLVQLDGKLTFLWTLGDDVPHAPCMRHYFILS